MFGFNQLFLATALLGFTTSGASAGFIPSWQVWLGYGSCALLFLSSSASPYNVEGANWIALIGLIGWLGWIRLDRRLQHHPPACQACPWGQSIHR